MASIFRTPKVMIARGNVLFFSRIPNRISRRQRVKNRLSDKASEESSKKAPPRSFENRTAKFATAKEAKDAIEGASSAGILANTLESASDFSHYRCHSPTFCRGIHRLAKFRRPDLVDRILAHHVKCSIGLPMFRYEKFWNELIKIYSDLGMIKEGMGAFRSMKTFFCVRTDRSLCEILKLHINNGKCDKAHEIFALFSKQPGLSLTVEPYNLLLRAFCQENKFDSARALLKKMEEDENNIKPDIGSYNILLFAYMKSDDATGFDAFLKEMNTKGLDFVLPSYRHMISMFCKTKDFDRARDLLNTMPSKDVKPDSFCYNTIIDALMSAENFDYAAELLEQMVTNAGNLHPNSSVYYSLIKNMVGRGEVELELALDLFLETLEFAKWEPPTGIAKDIVTQLVGAARTEDARNVANLLKKKAGEEEMIQRLKGVWKEKNKESVVKLLAEIESVVR